MTSRIRSASTRPVEDEENELLSAIAGRATAGESADFCNSFFPRNDLTLFGAIKISGGKSPPALLIGFDELNFSPQKNRRPQLNSESRTVTPSVPS